MAKLPRRPGGPAGPRGPSSKTPAPTPTPKSPGRLPGRPTGGATKPPPRGKGPAKASRPRPVSRSRPRGPGKPWFKILFFLFLALLLVVGAVGGYLFHVGRSSLPQIDGTAQLSGLSAPVEVLRDSRGVPHLFGSDVRDLARATGFVHAQDRLFQMEISRRSGAGTLAEIFGPEAVPLDRRARRFGLQTAATSELNRMAPEAREILEAYASGVNAYLAAHAEKLPPEFTLLELTPRPWQAVDSLAIGRSLAAGLSDNGGVELLRSRLADTLGLETAYRLTGLPAPLNPSARPVPRGSIELVSGFHVGGGSNAWVVSGRRSASGRPLLASDPHLDFSMPSVWYEIHISGGGLDVAGASLPGSPLVLIGRNQRIAWGATALYADVQDLYIETPNPDNPGQYRHGESYRDVDSVPETIQVKGASPITEEVRITRHGIVIGETSDGRWLAQRWDSLFSGDHILAVLRMNQAGSWQEFTEALRTWASPPVSFVYADVEGNIGFFPAGEIPVRTTHDGSFPVDGITDAWEWQGTVPHEMKPMVFNPEDGIIVSANHRMLAPTTPYPLGIEGLADFRAVRIRNLLTASPTLSLDDFERIQNDRYDAGTEPVLRFSVALTPSDAIEQRAVERLRNWSGQMTDGAAPAIYHALYRRLVENTLGDELGGDLFDAYLGFLAPGRPGGLHAILDDGSSPIWDDATTPEVEDRNAIFAKSLAEAVAMLSERHGSNMDAWDWRMIHGVEFSHPLAVAEPLRFLLSRGPSPFGGSTNTIASAAVSLREPFAPTHGTSFRFVTDLADIASSRWVVPTGASGHPLSPHYFDQNAAWLEGKSHPMLFDRNAVASGATGTLLLSP